MAAGASSFPLNQMSHRRKHIINNIDRMTASERHFRCEKKEESEQKERESEQKERERELLFWNAKSSDLGLASEMDEKHPLQ